MSNSARIGAATNPSTLEIEAKAFSLSQNSMDAYIAFRDSLTEKERDALRLLAVAMHKKSFVEFIGSLAAEDILNEQELQIFDAESKRQILPMITPATSMVIIFKATRLCNLRCTYCRSWAEGPNQIMTFPVMARAVRDILATPGLRRVEFIWHGGEVTLLKPEFFKKLIWLQQKFRQPGQIVSNSLQTNATHLTDDWIKFLSMMDMSVGISIDGPPEVHDKRRIDRNGAPTSKSVTAGIQRLRKANIPHGALIVVDQELVRAGAARLLEYLDEIGLHNLNFLNVIPLNIVPKNASNRVSDPHGAFIPFPEYVAYLKDVFELWWDKYRHFNVMDFADLLPAVQGHAKPMSCYWAGNCMMRHVTLEANGDLTPCDKYIGDPGSLMGNIMEKPVAQLLSTSQYIATEQRETAEGIKNMRSCQWFGVCQGGCPHDLRLSRRHVRSHDGKCCGLSPLLNRMSEVLKESGEKTTQNS